MKDKARRITAEAQLLNQLFHARKLAVHVPADGNGLPAHYLTPTTVVYDLAVPMYMDGDKLVRLQDDALSYICRFREMNNIITLDENGMEVMPTVRFDRYAHTVEVSRPSRDVLAWSAVNWTPKPLTAFCGLRYTRTGTTPVLWDVTGDNQVHGLIAGTTGSGKTNQLLSILYSLMLHNPPTALQVTIVDPKNSKDLYHLEHLPHIRTIVRELADSVATVEKFYREMERREAGVVDKSARHILVVEECASLTEHPDKNVRNQMLFMLADIARRCRESNMNLIICAQKPTADVLGDQLKSNLQLRLVGSVTSNDDAYTAVQVKQSGAEMLPGYGSFIYRLNRTMFRYQAPLIDTPVGICRAIHRKWAGAEVVQLAPVAPVRTGAEPETGTRTRVEQPMPLAPVHAPPGAPPPAPAFPLANKRPLLPDEIAEVRRLFGVMSKNQLCIHVYGAKSTRYMGWIDQALAENQPVATEKAPAPAMPFRGLVQNLKPL